MKKIFIFIITIVLVACHTKEPHPDYVEISGKIVNAKSKEISLYGMGGSKKVIPFQKNGLFKDTIKLKNNREIQQLMLMEDKIMTTVYFNNGDDVFLEADGSDFRNTLIYSLDNADYNNYLNKKSIILSSDIGFKKEWYRLDKEVFQNKFETLKNELNNTLKSYANIPQDKIESERVYTESYVKRFFDVYEKEHNLSLKLLKGTMSPSFEDYENYYGTRTSLSDFKGKYVYIDVWATWCGPCKAQIPFLEKIEKKFHDKNIVFVSISVDKAKDYTKWKDLVKEKNMSGIQLIAPRNFSSDFVKKYGINSIPRFILIDPEGKIVDFDAIRPSDPELNNQLNELL